MVPVQDRSQGKARHSDDFGPALTDPRDPVRTPGVPRPPALKALTSIRFFAALHVALYHLVRPFTLWGPLTPVMQNGYTGVSFFFVLSGFILTYAHAAEYESGPANKGRFWMARVARIYPVYFVCVALAGVLGASTMFVHEHWIALLADFLMLEAWSPRVVNFFHSGLWTLSCEAFFYLLFPFLILPLRPRSLRTALLWTMLFMVLAVATPAALLWRFPHAVWLESPGAQPGESMAFLVSKFPVFAVPEFLCGMSLGWLYVRFPPSARLSSAMASTSIVLIGVALLLSNHLPFLLLHNGLLLPLYALLLLGLSRPNWLSRVLSTSWLVLLGESSFALYLFHFLLIGLTDRWQVPLDFRNAAWRLAVVIPLSVLIYTYGERPCRKIILSWYTRRVVPTRRKA